MPVYLLSDEERRACYHAAVECRCENIQRRRQTELDKVPRPELPEHLEDLLRRPRGIGTGSFDRITMSAADWALTVEALRFKGEWFKGKPGPSEVQRLTTGEPSYDYWRAFYPALADTLEAREPIA